MKNSPDSFAALSCQSLSSQNALSTPQLIPHVNASCLQEITRTSHSHFVLAFRGLPKKKREAITKIYAFFRIIDDCVDEPIEIADKEIALAFWEKELEKISKNKTAHPLMEDLKNVINQYHVPAAYLSGAIAGCRMDITKNRYQNFEELHTYCYHVAGLVGLTCMKIFEYESPTSEQTAMHLGLAFQLTNILRDVAEDAQRNRIYLPLQDLTRFGCQESEWITQKKDTPQTQALIKHYANLAETYYLKAFEEWSQDKENKLVAAKTMSRLYYKILQKIRKRNYKVFQKRVRLNFLEKIWCLLKK